MSLPVSPESARADMALFAARNQARILRAYDAWIGGRGGSFCWPGLLAPQAWFLYRKMYLWAALVSAGPLLLAYVPKLAFLNGGTSLIGAFGLRLYLNEAAATIARIRAGAADEEAARRQIARAGGVSRVGAVIGLLFAFSAFVLSLKLGLRGR
ncbi:MAG: hypothetical protein KGM15_04440 [Pseudomonadota bacterium]|nr:hypothetical protein [Pseudomonadota bacterium]